MRVTINHRNILDHSAVREIVRASFSLHEVAGPEVEVHVKRSAEVCRDGFPIFSGRSYRFLPHESNVHPRTRRLVTLRLADPDAGKYPFTWHYHRAKTAVSPLIHSWEEALAYLAGHEARHVRQFEANLPTGEVDAEAGGLMALNHYRKRH